MEQVIQQVAQNVERQLDSELERSDSEFEAPSVVSVAPKKKSKASSSKRKAGPEKQRDSSPPLELTRTSSDKSAQRKRKYSSPHEFITTRLDALDSSDLETIRQQRIAEMKQRAKKKQEWLANGHGEYTEIDGEKEFFGVCNKSDNVVCHFYRTDTPRCRIVDMHLALLAKKHLETRFVKLDAERAPFLAGRLKIRVIPTIGLVKDNKTKDFIVGFTDLGNRDDFTTEMLEWRLAKSDVIEYSGDLLVPPDQARKQRALQIQSKKTIRGRADSDSDLDFSD